MSAPPRSDDADRRRTRVLRTDYLARVEGEGAMYVRIDGREILDIKLRIDEGPLRDLRRLIYCGEWIESHSLHVYMLHAPDFLGYASAVEMAGEHREVVEQGLQMKKAGNALMALVGGREVHPINVRVGGFYRAPRRRELLALQEPLSRARETALATVRWASQLPFPETRRRPERVALSDPRGEYPIDRGAIRSDQGLEIDPAEFGEHIVEEHVEHSNALRARIRERGTYLTGPLARYALSSGSLSAPAAQAAHEAGLADDCENPFQSIVVRAVELVEACDQALSIIARYEPPDAPAVEVMPRAGVGHGATEAPRGLLYHRYALDERGTILEATIVPPTSQNQLAIEEDLRAVVEDGLDLPDEQLSLRCEQAIRNHDPCISCATHFLTLTVDRG